MDIRKAKNLILKVLGGPIHEPEPQPAVKPLVMVVTDIREHAFQSWPETGLRHERTMDEVARSWRDMSDVPEGLQPKVVCGARYIESDGWQFLPFKPDEDPVSKVRNKKIRTRFNWNLIRNLQGGQYGGKAN